MEVPVDEPGGGAGDSLLDAKDHVCPETGTVRPVGNRQVVEVLPCSIDPREEFDLELVQGRQ